MKVIADLTVLPIGVGMASWFFHMLADITMGVLGYHLFVKVEKLPFPYAHPPAEACKALTRGQPEAKKVFTICGLIGTVKPTMGPSRGAPCPAARTIFAALMSPCTVWTVKVDPS